ncbi:MAG: Probable zinc protease pqqL [uncultured Sulfurovum sp.]|uniref:Probable zinc protease pqqL n=1 Tax=uncultured Sulfurovum sp. TaxID=269237 RepID=A0A6S6TBG2_9BACT|nr:MAG: Probable zinc protease pqqL [uncultured Sulfurovum sp.]
MKKIIFLLLLTSLLGIAKNLPTEPSLVEGQLNNGFKYSVMHNPKPKNRAELQLLIKVGSLEEADDQQGIAHFIEHMAFNGSKHFKKNQLIHYLESIGITFGNDLNANTNFEKTIYMLTVPLEKNNLQKSFTIFSDWAKGIKFDKEEFNKERGVILEEKRLRNTVALRMFNQYKNLLFANSPYPKRLPIGTKEVIENISIKRAKDFYETWYRPEFMHFIAVGDFNTTAVETLIKQTFSTLTNKSDKKRTPRIIPENNTTRIQTVWDQELTSNYLSLYYMDANEYLRTEENLRKGIMEEMLVELFNTKANEQIEKKEPKASSINLSSNILNKNRGFFKFTASYEKENELLALKELYEMIWSFNKYGFSEASLQRLKRAMLAKNEKQYKRIQSQDSATLSNQLLQTAFSNSIFVAYEEAYLLRKEFIHNITLEEINTLFRKIINFKDRVILFQNSQGKTYTEEAVLNTIKSAKNNIEDFTKEKKLPKNLLNPALPSSKIVNQQYDKSTDIHQFTLENGIKIAFKKTEFSKNRVLLRGFSFGGKSLYDANKLLSVSRATLFVDNAGAGNFSLLDLNKILLNKNILLSLDIEERTEEINAESNTADLESMFALLYLQLTQSKIDKNITRNIKNILKDKVQKLQNNPSEKFSQEVKEYYYKNNPRVQFETPESIESLNGNEMLTIFKDRFSDLNNFTFMIIGDISIEKIEKLSQKYLGNLPVSNRKEHFIKRNLDYRQGSVKFTKNYNHENISNISLQYKSKIIYSEKKEFILGALKEILNIRLRKLIREEKSGVYHINTNMFLDMLENKSESIISFSCNPNRKEELLKIVYDAIQKIKTEPVSQEELTVYQKSFTTYHQTALKQNNYWLSTMEKFYKNKIPFKRIYEQPKLIKKVTTEDILTLASEIFSEDYIQMELNPKL